MCVIDFNQGTGGAEIDYGCVSIDVLLVFDARYAIVVLIVWRIDGMMAVRAFDFRKELSIELLHFKRLGMLGVLNLATK